VRRQAVATLCCMLGIVKFQAIARGRRVRLSDVGLEAQNKYRLVQPQVLQKITLLLLSTYILFTVLWEYILFKISFQHQEQLLVARAGVSLSTRMAKLSANAFTIKVSLSSHHSPDMVLLMFIC